MCGLAGIAASRIGAAQVTAVERMCGLLHHRGPDDSGLHVEGRVVLGQTRLSIIDVAGGHQPLSNEDDSVWVACNGEIYNFVELRDELRARGHVFRSRSDTEVLVHLYEDQGIDMLHRLNGMFAFALWDARKRALFLARDRLGIKPLYYASRADGLAFASELKALLELPEGPGEIDREAIAEYLTLGYVGAPRTPFVRIRKLEAGCYLEFCGGRLRERRYWRIPEHVEHTARSVSELGAEIRALLEDATRLQLRSDVPVGLYASGGIDSTAIMWATKRQQISLQAFLCEFDDLKDDTPYARRAAEATGMPLLEAAVSAEDAGILLPRLVWHQDEPLADPAVVPAYLIAREATRSVKVILNGTGGDELFGGYPRYTVRALLPERWHALARPLAALGAAGRKAGAALDHRQRYLRRMTTLPEATARAALGLGAGEPVRDRFEALFREAREGDAAASMMFVDLHTYLPGDLLMLLDKMTMAASLEARVPLLDHRLVELAARLPGRLRLRNGDLKWLLRQALRGHVPDEILDRPKQGFGPPVASWMGGALGSDTRRLLLGRRARVAALMGRSAVQRWLSGTPAATAGRGWNLLILELWWRAFVDRDDLMATPVRALADAAETRWA